MRQRAAEMFPFAIAIVLPPAGLVLGLSQVSGDDRDLGIRLIVVAVIAAIVWTLLLLA